MSGLGKLGRYRPNFSNHMADAIGLSSIIQAKFDLDLGEIVDNTKDILPIMQSHVLTSTAKYVYKTYTFSKPVLSAATIGTSGSLGIPIGDEWTRIDSVSYSYTNTSNSNTLGSMSAYAKLAGNVLSFAVDLYLTSVKTVNGISESLNTILCVFYNTNDVAVS